MNQRNRILIAAGASLLGALALVALSAPFILLGYASVSQPGMYPTIHKDSLVVYSKRPYRDISQVRRGDIVLFSKFRDGANRKFIWRVLGVAGDRVQIGDDSVRVNGRPLGRVSVRIENDKTIWKESNDSATYEVAYWSVRSSDTDPLVDLIVPPNQVYVLGDNRDEAEDSRFIGPIPFGSIYGRKLW